MATIITAHEDKVFAECSCGCSIISLFRVSDDKFYLQHYGYSEDTQADFTFSSRGRLERFIQILQDASTAKLPETKSAHLIDSLVAVMLDSVYHEAIGITVDEMGVVGIQKYRKNYNKFLKHYISNRKNHTNEAVRFCDCRCDWDVCLTREQTATFVCELKKLFDSNEGEQA